MTGTIKCLKCGHIYHCEVTDDYPDNSGIACGCEVSANCPKCDGDDLEVIDAEHDDHYEPEDYGYDQDWNRL